MAIQISGTTVIDNSRNITNANIAASLINSGTLATARLGSGTANSSTYLRGDQCWAALPASGFSNMCVFTSPGSFTFPPSTTKFKATVTGGGSYGYSCSSCRTPGSAGGTGIILANATGGSTVSLAVGSAGSSPSPGGGLSCFGNYLKVCGGSPYGAAAYCPGIYRCCSTSCYLACLSMPPSHFGPYQRISYLTADYSALCLCIYQATSSSYWGSASGDMISSPCPSTGNPSTYGVGALIGSNSCNVPWACCYNAGSSNAAPGVVVIEW